MALQLNHVGTTRTLGTDTAGFTQEGVPIPVQMVGFPNRTDTTLAFDSGTRVFTLTKVNNFTVWVNNHPVAFTASQTTTLANATGLYFVYVDTAGVLQNSTTPWDIAGPAAPVATVYFNTAAVTEFILGDERHSSSRNPTQHYQNHFAIGAFWQSGLSGTFGATNGSISIATGEFHDEDVSHTVGSTLTQAKLVYRASGAWRVDALASDMRKLVSTIIQFDNAGTLGSPSNNNFVNYWVYCVNTPTPEIHVLVGQAQYASAALATAALIDSQTLPPWLQMEGRLLYRVTYQRTAGVPGGTLNTATDMRKITTVGGTTLAGSFLSTALPLNHFYLGDSSNLAAAVQFGIEPKTAPAISSGTLTLDCAAGTVFGVTMDGNITTLAFSNIPASGTGFALTLHLVGNGTAYTLTLPGSVVTIGSTPTIASASGKHTILVFETYDGGTTWFMYWPGTQA